MTPRFFCSGPLQLGAIVALDEASNHHALKVLRLQDHALIVLFNGDGHAYSGQLAVSGKRASAWIHQKSLPDPTFEFERILVQGISTSEKMAWTIEKAVELGVDTIVPLLSHRSKVKLSADNAAGKANRWSDLIKAACAQSGRNTVPVLAAPSTLESLISGSFFSADATKLMLQPDSSMTLLEGLPKSASPKIKDWDTASARRQIVLLCGPESGFDEGETQLLLRSGALGINLGWRVLRTETAGLAALACIEAVYASADTGATKSAS